LGLRLQQQQQQHTAQSSSRSDIGYCDDSREKQATAAAGMEWRAQTAYQKLSSSVVFDARHAVISVALQALVDDTILFTRFCQAKDEKFGANAAAVLAMHGARRMSSRHETATQDLLNSLVALDSFSGSIFSDPFSVVPKAVASNCGQNSTAEAFMSIWFRECDDSNNKIEPLELLPICLTAPLDYLDRFGGEESVAMTALRSCVLTVDAREQILSRHVDVAANFLVSSPSTISFSTSISRPESALTWRLAELNRIREGRALDDDGVTPQHLLQSGGKVVGSDASSKTRYPCLHRPTPSVRKRKRVFETIAHPQSSAAPLTEIASIPIFAIGTAEQIRPISEPPPVQQLPTSRRSRFEATAPMISTTHDFTYELPPVAELAGHKFAASATSSNEHFDNSHGWNGAGVNASISTAAPLLGGRPATVHGTSIGLAGAARMAAPLLSLDDFAAAAAQAAAQYEVGVACSNNNFGEVASRLPPPTVLGSGGQLSRGVAPSSTFEDAFAAASQWVPPPPPRAV
jgi:hypothetical protein